MAFANFEDRPASLQRLPRIHAASAARERGTDAWPDWSTDLNPQELDKMAQKNKPAIVLWEAAGIVLYSVGLVLLLMMFLGALQR